MNPVTCSGEKRALDPLELELQAENPPDAHAWNGSQVLQEQLLTAETSLQSATFFLFPLKESYQALSRKLGRSFPSILFCLLLPWFSVGHVDVLGSFPSLQ